MQTINQDMLGYIRLFQTLYNADMDYLANHNGNNDKMFENWDNVEKYIDIIANKEGKKIVSPTIVELTHLGDLVNNFEQSLDGFQQQGFEADENSNVGNSLIFYAKQMRESIQHGIEQLQKNKGNNWDTIFKVKKQISATLPSTLVDFYNAYSKYFWSVKEEGFKDTNLNQSNFPTFFAKIFDNCHEIGNDQAHYAALNSKTTEQKEVFNRWYDIVSYDSDILISHIIRLARQHPCYKQYKKDRELDCSKALNEDIKLDSKKQIIEALKKIKNRQFLYITEEQLSMLKKWLTAEVISYTIYNNVNVNRNVAHKIKPSFNDRASQLAIIREQKLNPPQVEEEEEILFDNETLSM